MSKPERRSPSVLHVIAPGEVGGAETVVSTLAAGMRSRGARVGVLAVLDEGVRDHPLLASLTEGCVDVFPVRLPPRAYLRERRILAETLRAFAPDVVHTHGYRADVMAGGVARRLACPTVSTVHGYTGGGVKNRFYEWLQRRTITRFDAVVAVARPLVDQLADAGVARECIHFIQNAWAPRRPFLNRSEARAALGLPERGYVVGWVGRLSREKGADVFIEALAYLRDLPVTASVLGGGAEEATLRALADGLDLGDRIRWHGIVPEAGTLLRAFDAFALSSRTEGTPIVLFEAMAAGVPIVAAAVGGVPDVVSSREAFLVPPEDPARLAAVLRALHTGTDVTGLLVSARHRLEAEFGIEPWLDRYEDLYWSMLASSRPGSA